MATSPNFSWPEPDNSDLVKNGALAIRTAVDAIDSSMVDLKGGTTGQVLSKASNTDMDFTWVTDATGIPATIFDAKGDIIAATAADTASRLAVGTNGQVLTADSTAATGLKWATPSSGSTFIGCRVTKSGSQSVATATTTAITWDVEDYDTNSMHDNSTNNSRMTVPSGQGGYWLVQANLVFANPNSAFGISIYKNGVQLKFQYSGNSFASDQDIEITAILNLAAGDYIEIFGRHNKGSNTNVTGNSNDPQNSAFQMMKVG